MSREIRRFDVTFKNPAANFDPGDVVTGTVNLDTATDIKLKGIKFALQGVGRVQWDESKSYTKGTSSNLSHKNMEVYLDEVMIMHRAEGGVLKMGMHSYPFTIRLPPFLPATYEGQHGRVMYWAKAYLDRPWKGDTEYKKSFSVKGLLDLNTEPDAKNPIEGMNEMMAGTLCCKSGPVIGHISTSKRGYVPAQNIPFAVSIQNKSKRKLTTVRVTLSQQVTFRADKQVRKTNHVLKGVAMGNVGANEECKWEDEIKNIPPVPPTKLGGSCKNIEVKYFLSLVAIPSGPGKSLEVPVEIIIGTIPLRKTEQGTPQLTVKAALQQIKGGDTLDPSKLVKGQRISPRPSPQAQRAPIATAK